MQVSSVNPISVADLNADECGLFVFACGFEERAIHFFRSLNFPNRTKVLMFEFQGGPPENARFLKNITEKIKQQAFADIQPIPSYPNSTHEFEMTMNDWLNRNSELGKIWIDISGFPNWALATLFGTFLKKLGPRAIRVLYTSAQSYFPTKEECEALVKGRRPKAVATLPPSALTSEYRINLIPDIFAGNSIDLGQTCLIIFPGYEVHRSQAAIEDINPAKIVVVYGTPPRSELRWRVEFSKACHASIIRNLNRSQKEIATDDVCEATNEISRIYSYLYDDHLIRIAPLNSKLHTVAAVLAWFRFRDIQLCFPQAIRYLPNRFSSGIGPTYSIEPSIILNQIRSD